MKKHWIILTAVALFIIGIILNFTYRNMFSADKYSFNYFACGDYAFGVFAAGKFSAGIFSVGIFSVGIFSTGIFNVALYAIGIFSAAHKRRIPKLFLALRDNKEEKDENNSTYY